MPDARRSSPARPERGRPVAVEALRELLEGLLREREDLRAAGDRASLERNRLEIGALQRRISRALAARHGG